VKRGSVRVVTVSSTCPMGVRYRLAGLAHCAQSWHSHLEHVRLTYSAMASFLPRLMQPIVQAGVALALCALGPLPCLHAAT